MTDLIPTATLEHLLMVQHAASNKANPDLGEAVRSALGGMATPQEMMAVAIRLVALTNLRLSELDLEKDNSTIDIAVLKAAARAPLFKGSCPALTTFDLESFKEALREESQT